MCCSRFWYICKKTPACFNNINASLICFPYGLTYKSHEWDLQFEEEETWGQQKEETQDDEERGELWLLFGRDQERSEKPFWNKGEKQRRSRGSTGPWPQGKCATDAQCVRVWVIDCLAAPHGNAGLFAHLVSDTSTPDCSPWTPRLWSNTQHLQTHRKHTHQNTHPNTLHRLYIHRQNMHN